MGIRIRRINGRTVALCAAKTSEQEGDVYLGEEAHHALYVKFALDFESEGLLKDPLIEAELKQLMQEAERS